METPYHSYIIFPSHNSWEEEQKVYPKPTKTYQKYSYVLNYTYIVWYARLLDLIIRAAWRETVGLVRQGK